MAFSGRTHPRKSDSSRGPETRYILRLADNDRYTLAEYYDGGFTESVLEVRRTDGSFRLEATSHHYNSRATNTDYVNLRPFGRFDDFFSQLTRFCKGFDLDAGKLRSDARLMRFLSLI